MNLIAVLIALAIIIVAFKFNVFLGIAGTAGQYIPSAGVVRGEV